MEQADDEAIKARLAILKEQLEAGKIQFAPGLKVIESLKSVRHGPDGQIDLATVDGGVRALATMAAYSKQRAEAKDAISLADLQQGYFDFVDKNLGWLYAEMKKQGADPSQVGSALASNPKAVQDVSEGIPEFLDWIDGLWKDAADPVHYHVQDISGLKAVFGGETFPLGRKNIVSCSGVYADTIVLPDPFLRTRVFYDHDQATAVRWFVKSAMSLLHYREAALADVKIPLVVIAPDRSLIDDSEQEQLLRASTPSALAHLKVMFGIEFASIEEAEAFLKNLPAAQDVMAKLVNKERLLFDVDDDDPLEQQIEDYMNAYLRPFYEGGAGDAVLMSANGRMRQATDLLRRSAWLGGTPLIDAPTSWRYFVWKLGYQAESAPDNPGLHLHMTQALQSAARHEMEWLGKVPIEALIEMRRQDALPELRQMLTKGVEALMELRPDNFHRTGDQVIKNIQDAFDDHRKKLTSLTGKKWRFAGIELGACIVKGAVQIASACGVPGVSLLGTAIDQAVDVPKVRELPKKFRTLKNEHKKLHSSAVGLLFDASQRH